MCLVPASFRFNVATRPVGSTTKTKPLTCQENDLDGFWRRRLTAASGDRHRVAYRLPAQQVHDLGKFSSKPAPFGFSPLRQRTTYQPGLPLVPSHSKALLTWMRIFPSKPQELTTEDIGLSLG